MKKISFLLKRVGLWAGLLTGLVLWPGSGEYRFEFQHLDDVPAGHHETSTLQPMHRFTADRWSQDNQVFFDRGVPKQEQHSASARLPTVPIGSRSPIPLRPTTGISRSNSTVEAWERSQPSIR